MAIQLCNVTNQIVLHRANCVCCTKFGQGACPACKRQFVGYKNQVIRCASCGNTVWQPKGDFFSRDGRGPSSSKSEPEIIDVEFEEK